MDVRGSEQFSAPPCAGFFMSQYMNNTIEISLPDRYDMLQRKAVGQLSQIISPVEDALDHVDMLYSDMKASSRGALLIIRGDSGTGKSTFIHTIGLFRDEIETLTITKEEDIGRTLDSLATTHAKLRIVVLEGREALTDVSKELLEKSIHSINSFIRTPAGEHTLIAWPVNRDDLAQKLSELAAELGAEAMTGLGDPIYKFPGPPKSEFLKIANNTIALLNQGEQIHDLGISSTRAEELLHESATIGIFLAKIRKDLLTNQKALATLAKKEPCRVWIVVLAGNEPDSDIDGVTRGTMYSADIDRMLSVTNANVVQELKQHPEKLGLLGTYFDARVLHIPVLAALAAVRTYASGDLKKIMKAAGMSTSAQKDTKDRIESTNFAFSFKNTPIGARKVGGKIGSNSEAAFEKLTNIAASNDIALNKALAECLLAIGIIKSYKLEQDFGKGLTRRTDIVATTENTTIRLEMMWRRKTGRAEISNYVLTKLFNYGKAIGYLE
jgi:DNA (cytosine-5)-methyltransferase 1